MWWYNLGGLDVDKCPCFFPGIPPSAVFPVGRVALLRNYLHHNQRVLICAVLTTTALPPPHNVPRTSQGDHLVQVLIQKTGPGPPPPSESDEYAYCIPNPICNLSTLR